MQDDFIEVIPNALPSDFCDRLVKTLDTHSGAYQGRTGAGVDLSKKVSTDLMLDEHPDLNELRQELMMHTFVAAKSYFAKYFLALFGAVSVTVKDSHGNSVTITPDNFESLGRAHVGDAIGYLFRSGTINLQKYKRNEGGYPHWHSEQYPQPDSYDALHRVVLYMYYLNDVSKGGETEFFYQQRSVVPAKGTMVIAPAGFTHSHRGNMPISNDKYIATSWIMFNKAEKLYGS